MKLYPIAKIIKQVVFHDTKNFHKVEKKQKARTIEGIGLNTKGSGTSEISESTRGFNNKGESSFRACV